MGRLRVNIFIVFFILFGISPAFFVFAGGRQEADIPRPEILEEEPPISGPYYTGDGGAEVSLAVLQPNGVGLDKNEEWVLSFIQGVLAADFTKYSQMTISDRQRLDNVPETRQSSPELSAAESIEIGNLINVKYILTGSLQKISNVEFLFQLAVINTETGVRQASHMATVTDLQLKNAGAVKIASEDLLGQMGVVLTDAGRMALHQERPSELEAEIALARGITAENNGNTIESLSYLYNAVSYDAVLPEAEGRLESLSARVSSGGLGDAIRDDFENRAGWKKILDEFEAFYTEHPPFEIVYSPNLVQKGITDYEASGGATVDLEFGISFRESPDLSTMRKVYQNIRGGLIQTARQENWGFAKWPYSADLFNGFKDYAIQAELVNDNGEVLKVLQFDLSGRLFVMRDKIYPDSDQKQSFIFPTIPVDKLTSNPVVRIVSINGVDAEKSGEDGYIRILPMTVLPSAYSRHLLVLVTRDFMNIH
jgi:hypothetical protein